VSSIGVVLSIRKTVSVEQQGQVIEAEVIDKSEGHTVDIFRQIGRRIAQNYIVLAETQMGEEIFKISDALEHAQHHDHVAL
jgi:hypothetical protein